MRTNIFAMILSQSIEKLIGHIKNKLFIILQFRKWFDDAVAAGLREPNAMALSTVGKQGKP